MAKTEDSEKYIESLLFRKVKELGGHALKYTSQTETGYPDRLVLLPLGRAYWVELKSKGKKLRKLQEIRRKELSQLGFEVFVIDSIDKINNFIKYVSYDRR